MNSRQQQQAAKDFAARWADDSKGHEKQDSQNFWHDLLHTVYGVDNPALVINFERKVNFMGEDGKKQHGFIDGYIGSSRVLIEQKGKGIDLNKKEEQSDGALLTPFEQGHRYASALPLSEMPRYIIACNFTRFQIYDLNVSDPLTQEPITIELADLPKSLGSLSFLTDLHAVAKKAQVDISVQAGALIGKLYDALLKQYGAGADKDDDKLKSLNKLCVRLVFCLYAEDSGLFTAGTDQFGAFLRGFAVENLDTGLEKLFRVLNTKPEDRPSTLQPKFADFPYVNGGLFADDDSEIPPFNEEIAKLLIEDCSEAFDWSKISPTIFGAIFESTLNPQTRRQGGMHYTSEENIHKVIDPLFLDELKAELESITNDSETKYSKRGRDKLRAFQDKLASLKFLDPACGSGNFLTETYICLRRLENEALRHLSGDMGDLFALDPNYSPVKVNLSQFYGIEINDFAVTVAKTALWIAESQLLQETEAIVGRSINFLPLKAYSNIREGNALKMDWEQVVPKAELNYIMGNPPFYGARWMTAEQKQDLLDVFGKDWKGVGNIDYVSGWYKKAADYIKSTAIQVGYVSTNSITQGEQVPALWKGLTEQGIVINFAYRTFVWDSEAAQKAHVHCVIVGFSDCPATKDKKIVYDQDGSHEVRQINPYLIDASTVFIESRTKPLCDVPVIGIGNQPIDGGNYLFTPEEKADFIRREPNSEQYFRPWYGADEFINNRQRWCLWLGDCSPAEIKNMPLCFERVKAVKAYRLTSKRANTRELAETPTRFHFENMPKGKYIVIPEVSSQRRFYVPMGYMNDTVMCSNKLKLMPNATTYHFGVLESLIHMAWMRVVTGRLKSDYSYSVQIVYNNFVWPDPSVPQHEKIEETAQAILDARKLSPDSTLADLYDPDLMPDALRKAHQANDRAVLAAYGLKKGVTEEEIVAHLFKLYELKTKEISDKA